MSTQNFAISTTIGARPRNEDFEYAIDLENFAIVLILDGHSGQDLKDKLGLKLSESLLSFFKEADENLEIDFCVETISNMLTSILSNIDKETPNLKGGATLSLGLVQKKKNYLYTFQIGDSMIFMADTNTGDIVSTCKIYASDNANKEKDLDLGYQKCITKIHDFTNNDEEHLFQKLCKSVNKRFKINSRKDASEEEGRVLAMVDYRELPEPSRTIESSSFYKKNRIEFLKETQRTPEISVWHFESLENLAVCAVCDGFVSKICLPSIEKIAQVIINPGKYICCSEIMDETLIGKWLEKYPKKWVKDTIKPGNSTWDENPILHANRLIYNIAPDTAWKNAVNHSLETITNIRERFPDELNIKTDIQACLDMAVQIPVSLASDDNVSVCVVIL